MDLYDYDNLEDDSDNVDAVFDATLDFQEVIDPAKWVPPDRYYREMPSTTRVVIGAVVESDNAVRRELREQFLPELSRKGVVWERANPRYIEALQRKYLYTGRAVASDGTLAKYETLSLVGAQIAISRVGYQGQSGQFVTNIMHWGKELPRKVTAAAIVEALNSRGKRLKNKLSNIFLQALMKYKEREILLDSPHSTFKLIHGPVFPHEMLTGSGRQFLMQKCLNLLGDLIDDGQFANIVSEDTHGELVMLGTALEPGEYLVTSTGDEVLEVFSERANYTSTPIPQYGGKSQIELFNEFKRHYGHKVVQGVFRAHQLSRPYVFYCNSERLPEAIHMLLADAANTGARGFPLLIDMADRYCAGAFKASEYTSYMKAEFVRASGGSGMYLSERSTRD